MIGSSCSRGSERQIGQLLPVTIYDANAFTLFGAVVTQHVGPEVYALSLSILFGSRRTL